MSYHQTKFLILTMRFIGHRTLDSTLLYIYIDETIFKESNDELTVKAAKTSKEIKSLLEVGFEYICKKDELMFLRKRK